MFVLAMVAKAGAVQRADGLSMEATSILLKLCRKESPLFEVDRFTEIISVRATKKSTSPVRLLALH